MEGRRWSYSSFEEEKKHFLRQLEKDPVFAARRKAFNARKEKEEIVSANAKQNKVFSFKRANVAVTIAFELA